jgi:hypothetical protein
MDEEAALRHIQQRLDQVTVHIHVADQYRQTYAALLDLGARTEISNISHIRALSCAAYGWMPRIIGPTSDEQLQQLAQNAETFASLTTLAEGADFVGSHLVRPLIGNSWIGTSKLLHFLKPDVFPTYDTKVAGRFGLEGYDLVNEKNAYVQYLHFCRDFLQSPQCPDLLAWWQDGGANFNLPNNQAPTQLRILEIILFA